MNTTTAPRSPSGGRGHVASYGHGRICAEETCSTTLSRYNHEHVCGVHGVAPTK